MGQETIPSGNTTQSRVGSGISTKKNFQMSQRVRNLELRLADMEKKLRDLESRILTVYKVTRGNNNKLNILVKR